MHTVSETHLIQLIFKAYKCRKYDRNRGRMQRQIVPKWPKKACIWKRWTDMISDHCPPSYNINLLFFSYFFFFFVHKASKRWWEELVEKSFSFLLGLFLTKEDRTALMMSFSSTPSPAILLLLFDSCQKSTPNSSSHQNANKQILMHQRITHMYCQILTIPFVQLELQEHTPVQIWSLTT